MVQIILHRLVEGEVHGDYWSGAAFVFFHALLLK